ncbi:PKD domain-containing protein [Burkholderia sp. LMU1-1-1.1]|uniref:PKD domain-containing protein n=1 Tax=Burkholderia sp. LMU1-1-1.1 TaxID=3135266 RepID=UPI0034447492
MQFPSIRAIAALCAPLPFWAAAHATPADPQTSQAGQPLFGLYTVINLGPEPTAARLNERGQAAFTDENFPDTNSHFFDGDRIRPIGSLGGGFTSVIGLNSRGVVVGASTDAAETGPFAYAWTLAGGMRALPGPPPAAARDVNNRNEIVGQVSGPDVASRALRWNPDGSVTQLGPPLAPYAQANAINLLGYSTGVTSGASEDTLPHAVLWDRTGGQTDLTPFAGGLAYGLRINDRNEVAGIIADMPFADFNGLFWSRATGALRIDAGIDHRLGDLNNRGELVGSGETGEQRKAFQWTVGRGVVRLPVDASLFSHAADINERGEIVGVTLRPTGEGRRAVRWPSFAAMPVDLNTRLYRAPAGLELLEALAINDGGTILANSNAGLVMLRPGLRGTDAPVLGPIAGLPTVVELGQELALTINFVDNARAQTHNASAVWTDGCASPAPTVSEAGGYGQVRLRHRFCAAGVYTVTVVVTDSGGRATELRRHVYVDAPGLAALSGEGALAGGAAPAGRGRHGRQQAPLRFALWAPLDGTAPADGAAAGPPVAWFSGPFHFRSESVTRAIRTGEGRVRVAGTGRLDGRAGYRFVLEAVDGGAVQGAGLDRLRLRVTHADAATGAEVVDYDNEPARPLAGADRTVVVEGGLTLRR